jgi:hypothetical protein
VNSLKYLNSSRMVIVKGVVEEDAILRKF